MWCRVTLPDIQSVSCSHPADVDIWRARNDGFPCLLLTTNSMHEPFANLLFPVTNLEFGI